MCKYINRKQKRPRKTLVAYFNIIIIPEPGYPVKMNPLLVYTYITLQRPLIQGLVPDLDKRNAYVLFLVEVKAQHIPHVKPEIVKILR